MARALRGPQLFVELTALAKAKPHALTYASSGVGGIAHLGFVLFNAMAGTRMVHVPYKGSPPQTLATVAGEVAMTSAARQKISPLSCNAI